MPNLPAASSFVYPRFKYSLHSQTNRAAMHKLLLAKTALSSPTSSQAGNPAIHPLMTARVAAGCEAGNIDPSSRVGFSSTPGHTFCVRYERIGFAVRTCRSLNDSPLPSLSDGFAGVGAGAQQRSVSVSRYRSSVLTMS